MIPKVIHYCWFGGNPLPKLAKKCIESWRHLCPDYEIAQWNEQNFDVHQHPFIESAYEAKAWAFVSDWARLKIIYDNGGIYLDTDVELLKSLDTLLEHQCYIGVQQNGRLCTTGLGFGAAKASPVVHEMLAEYDDFLFKPETAKRIACPGFNDKVIRKHGYNGDGSGQPVDLGAVCVYPCRFFDPISLGNSENLKCLETVSIHHYANSWGSPRETLKRKLINTIGIERVDALKRMR